MDEAPRTETMRFIVVDEVADRVPRGRGPYEVTDPLAPLKDMRDVSRMSLSMQTATVYHR